MEDEFRYHRSDVVGLQCRQIHYEGKSTRSSRRDLYDVVPYAKFNWHPSRIVDLGLIFMWGLFMWSLWVMKEVLEENSTYWMYLTNWSWFFQAVFWLGKFLGYMESLAFLGRKNKPDYVLYYVYFGIMWPVFMVNTGVTFVVILVLYDAPGLLTNYIGDYDAGFVFLMNTIFHVLTFIFMLFSMYLTRRDLEYMLFRNTRSLIIYYVSQYFLGLLLVGIYLGTHDPYDVYNLDDTYPYWFLIMIFAFVIYIPSIFGVLTLSSWDTGFHVGASPVIKKEKGQEKERERKVKNRR